MLNNSTVTGSNIQNAVSWLWRNSMSEIIISSHFTRHWQVRPKR